MLGSNLGIHPLVVLVSMYMGLGCLALSECSSVRFCSYLKVMVTVEPTAFMARE